MIQGLMTTPEPDSEAAKITVRDGGEATSLAEPFAIEESSPRYRPLADLAFDLASRAAAFQASVPTSLRGALPDLVRSMNCYYSNLIEGHDTHPVDIERAMQADYSADAVKRDLQLEARAHVEVQAWIDEGGLNGNALTRDGIQEVHERFCERLPTDLLIVTDPDTGASERVVPGALRERDVRVGRHLAPSPGALPRFLERFESVYAGAGRTQAVLAAAAAHHRLLWIHPFLDGNGRVARLMSHAVLREALGVDAIWSVARGLARNEADYKTMLANADMPRRNDLDGRGTLSEEGLAAFISFFLQICLDQVAFMESLVEPARLRERIVTWAEREAAASGLHKKASTLLEAVLFRGELARGDIDDVIGGSERTARRVTSDLLSRGALVSDSPRAPVRLGLNATLAGTWMPGLFPDRRS